jgi:hypothetical protein
MQTTMKLVQNSIPLLRSSEIQNIFISTTLAEYDELLVQISEETWPDVVGRVKEIEVTLEEPPRSDSPGGPFPGTAGDSPISVPMAATPSKANQGMSYIKDE